MRNMNALKDLVFFNGKIELFYHQHRYSAYVNILKYETQLKLKVCIYFKIICLCLGKAKEIKLSLLYVYRYLFRYSYLDKIYLNNLRSVITYLLTNCLFCNKTIMKTLSFAK